MNIMRTLHTARFGSTISLAMVSLAALVLLLAQLVSPPIEIALNRSRNPNLRPPSTAELSSKPQLVPAIDGKSEITPSVDQNATFAARRGTMLEMTGQKTKRD